MPRRESAPLNKPLAVAMVLDGRLTYVLATAVKIHPSRLSGLRHGAAPTPMEAERLAAALDVPVETLFPPGDFPDVAIATTA